MRRLFIIPWLLFGLVFSGGGYLIFTETGLPMWQNWQRMQGWQPGSAGLLSFSGSDNNTLASYQYDFAGTRYRGSTIGVSQIKDNIGSYQREMQAYLGGIQRTDSPLPIWIDPANPAESVIDRDMRWGLFALSTGFSLIFILIGGVVAYASITSLREHPAGQPSLTKTRKAWREAQRAGSSSLSFLEYYRQQSSAPSPTNPAGADNSLPPGWQSRKGWERAQIRSDASKEMWIFWFLALLWNAVSIPLAFVLPDELQRQNYAALFILLFPALGVFLVYRAINRSLEYRRFGRVLLTLDPYPGAIGGHVGGQIQVDKLDYRRASEAAELSITLECVYSYVSGSGDNRSRRENIKWAQRGTPKIDRALNGVNLAFRFSLPDNLPAADIDQSGAYHFWRLGISAQIPGIDLKRSYNIPVFATAATSRHSRHDISAQVSARQKQQSETSKLAINSGRFEIEGLSRALRVRTEGDRISLRFPMFRNKLLSMICAIFAGGFGFASYSMAETASSGGLFGLFMFIFAIPFFLVALFASIAMIYLPLNNLQVTLANGAVQVTRRLLFIPVYRKRLARADIAHLSIKRSGSTGQGIHKVEHFKIHALDKQGSRLTLAEDIDGEDIATHFRDYLAQRLGVEVS